MLRQSNTRTKVDLHCHSIASDGTWNAAQLVGNAVKAGIGLLAVTDHHCMALVEEACRNAHGYGIDFVAGAELCATYEGNWYHVLALGVEPDHAQFLQFLETNRELTLRHQDEQLFLNVDAGRIDVDLTDYAQYTYDCARGAWKAFNYLVDKQWCRDLRDFSVKIRENGCVFDEPTYPHPTEVRDMIHVAGGLAILAHPCYEFREIPLRTTLQAFADLGYDGVECFHPKHNPVEMTCSRDFCLENGLLVTGGSDCHGDLVKARYFGHPDITRADVSYASLYERRMAAAALV